MLKIQRRDTVLVVTRDEDEYATVILRPNGDTIVTIQSNDSVEKSMTGPCSRRRCRTETPPAAGDEKQPPPNGVSDEDIAF